jgi:hypothetical protein
MTMTPYAGVEGGEEIPAMEARSPRVSTHLLNQVKGEYIEMPGLRLTLAQAARLWQLDAMTCRVVLRTLVEAGFLRESTRGGFQRSDG